MRACCWRGGENGGGGRVAGGLGEKLRVLVKKFDFVFFRNKKTRARLFFLQKNMEKMKKCLVTLALITVYFIYLRVDYSYSDMDSGFLLYV